MADAPTFADVVHRQRAHRAFSNDDVTDDVIESIVELAACAPSAENSQPWEVVVVRDAGARSRIGELTDSLWRAGAADAVRDRMEPEHFADVEAGATGGVAAAPVLLVIGGDRSRCHPEALAPSIWPFVQNVLLAATAAGLGSALTTLPTAAGADLAGIVGLPDHVVPFAVLPLGHPASELGPPRRDAAPEHLHRDRYGHPWT